MSDIVRILKEARELISDPDSWTQGAYARDGSEEKAGVFVSSPFAKCFCTVGAIAKVSRVPPGEAEHTAPVIALAEAVGLGDTYEVIEFNDTHTHDEVLAMFDKAIMGALAVGEQA